MSTEKCKTPPPGWKCTRKPGHEGPCAAIPIVPKDCPEMDATDFAHPAWWRGNDHAVAIMCQKVHAILDGKDDGSGANVEPWASVRRRLLALMGRPWRCIWCGEKEGTKLDCKDYHPSHEWVSEQQFKFSRNRA